MSFFSQLVLEQGIAEDHTLGDTKLVIMYVAIAAGCVAQFWPMPFPANRMLLAVCAAVYFLLSAVYQYWVWYVERDVLFTSRPAAPGAPVLRLRSRLPKFDDVYAVDAECPRGTSVASARASVGKFFTKKGEFSHAHFNAFARRTLLPGILAAVARSKKEQ